MPHVSKRIIDSKIKRNALGSFTLLIKDLNNVSDTEKFLSSVLSETERLMIAKRITAAFLLRHNIESQKIQNLLKLTPGTVFRLKLWIQTHQEGFDVIFDKMEKQRRSELTKEILYRILDYAIKAGSGRVPNPFKDSSQYS
ncbi:MAG: Trp family transcriptional regulator [Candidatus Woesebacteria bacterium]|nr:Trp family transcriptional regulator [Candidatus Woesebacteria bacterium]